MEGVVVDYFQNLFISSNPHAIDEVVELVDRNVTSDMNSNRCQSLWTRLSGCCSKLMYPSKALGLDGMTLFFQKYWHIVGWGGGGMSIMQFWISSLMEKCLSV